MTSNFFENVDTKLLKENQDEIIKLNDLIIIKKESIKKDSLLYQRVFNDINKSISKN